MQDRRIEVGAVGPHQRMNFRIDFNSGKKRGIAKRSVNLARQDWLQIDFSYIPIIKTYPQPIGTQNVYCGHAVDWMAHTASSTQGLLGFRARLAMAVDPVAPGH